MTPGPPARRREWRFISTNNKSYVSYAINKVYGQDEFSFGGHIYEKSGGSTFLKHDEIPGGAVEVHPNAAAEIDAKRLDDATMDYKRQEYLRKRDEWHNTPDTPGGMELEHSPRSHDPDNTPEREERIVGDAKYLSKLVPAAASFATGGFALALPVAIANHLIPPVINSALNAAGSAKPFGNAPAFSHLQPHIDI